MLRTLIALSVVFGLVVAGPTEKALVTSKADAVSTSTEDNSEYRLDTDKTISSVTLLYYLVINGLNALVGYKVTALSLAVKTISWLVAHTPLIVIGAALTLGLCKLTNGCTLEHPHYENLHHFRSFVTPERLDSVERFLAKAIETYADETKKGRS